MTEAEQEAWLRSELDRCWHWIYAAIKKTDQGYGREYLEKRLFVDRDSQLWPNANSAIVTQIDIEQDGSKTLIGWLAGGDRWEIEDATPRINAWAKRQGCVRSRLIQRPGFAKKPIPGYRLKAVIFEKEL